MFFIKSYSVLLLPHDSKDGQHWHFRPGILNAVLLIVAILTAVSGFLVVRHYRYHFKLVTTYEPTFKENERLNIERKSYGRNLDSLSGVIAGLEEQVKRERNTYLSSVNELAAELDGLKRLAVKVKIQAGFKTNNIVDEADSAGGPADDRTYVGYYDVGKPIQTSLLEQRLYPDMAVQSVELAKVDAYLSTKESLISATPELAPLFGRMTSNFGIRRWRRSGHTEGHEGIDIAVPKGTPVYAPAEGVVIYCDRKGDYGNLIELDHGNGYTTRFGHLSGFDVEIGDRVVKGQIIGEVGSTGRSTGPHLHYEVRLNGKPIDPIDYLGSVQ